MPFRISFLDDLRVMFLNDDSNLEGNLLIFEK
jgi:hypothetical protein